MVEEPRNGTPPGAQRAGLTESLPLSAVDRDRLAGKASRAHAALRTCLVLVVILPLLFVTFLFVTPTELTWTTLLCVVVVCSALALPTLAKCFDLRRTLRRISEWSQRDQKVRLTGEVTGKGPLFVIRVGGMGIAAWERSKKIAIGDTVTVEYLPLGAGNAGIVGVLSVDGEPNPYFESAWRSGPPTA